MSIADHSPATEQTAPIRSTRPDHEASAGADPVRLARERLAHDTSDRPEFEYELHKLFAAGELATATMLPLIAVTVAIAHSFWLPLPLIALWLALILAAKLVLLWQCRSFLRCPQSQVNVGKWRNRLAVAELVYGLSWASIAIFTSTITNPAVHFLNFAILMLVIATRMMFAQAHPWIIRAGTLPIILILMADLALQNTGFFWALTALSFSAFAYFSVSSERMNESVLAMLRYRAEKDALIAELEEARAISDEARRRAESANYAKSRFLATMSHELRTPLNAILGFSDLMREERMGAHSSPLYKEYADDIHNSGQHLLELINGILDMSKIEAGRFELKEEAVFLADIAEECQKLLKLRAQSKTVRIELNIDENLYQVWADERSLRQICLNLLSNAIKFTPKGGQIVVTVGQSRNRGQFISVRDTGPGIPEEEIPRILSSFGQGSLAHQSAEGGTGLGLPIVQGLTSLHGGTFDIRSKLREGTEVIITLPRSRVMRALPQLALRKGTQEKRRTRGQIAKRGIRRGIKPQPSHEQAAATAHSHG